MNEHDSQRKRNIGSQPCAWCGSTKSVRTYTRTGTVECKNGDQCMKRFMKQA